MSSARAHRAWSTVIVVAIVVTVVGIAQPSGTGAAGARAAAAAAAAAATADASTFTSALDPAFGTGGKVTTVFKGTDERVRAMATLPDGRIVVAGNAWTSDENQHCFAVLRYLPDGTLDPTWSDDGKVGTDFDHADDWPYDLELYPDGAVLTTGFGTVDGVRRFGLVRYRPDGTLDPAFGEGGVAVGQQGVIHASAVQPDGRIVAAGYTNFGDLAVDRYLPDGSYDTTFGRQGRIILDFNEVTWPPDVQAQADAQGFVPPAEQAAVGGGFDRANAVELLPDGRIVLVGSGRTGGRFVHAAARLHPDGDLDPTFHEDGKVTLPVGDGGGYDEAFAMLLDDDGSVVLGGYGRNGDDDDWVVSRIDGAGALDPTFGAGGTTTVDVDGGHDGLRSLVALPDGRLVLAGNASVADRMRFGLLVLDQHGVPDTGFSPGGVATYAVGMGESQARVIVPRPGGGVLVAGFAAHAWRPAFGLMALAGPDDPPRLSVDGPATMEEGTSHEPTSVRFSVKADRTMLSPATVHLDVTDQDGAPVADATVTLLPGGRVTPFTLTLPADGVREGDVALTARLTGPAGAVLDGDGASHTVTVHDDDGDVPVRLDRPVLREPREGTRQVPLTLRLAAPAQVAGAATVAVDPGPDITAPTTVPFAAGATTVTVPIDVVADGVREPDEHVRVRVTVPAAVAGTDGPDLGDEAELLIPGTAYPDDGPCRELADDLVGACIAADVFTDVDATSPLAEPIGWMADWGIAGAYPDGGFHPADAVTRQAAAAWLYRLAGEPDGDDPGCATDAFPDVPADHPFCGEVAWMVAQGLTTGYADGGFHPTSAVSRQALVAWLWRQASSPAPGPDGPTFVDVGLDHPTHDAIAWAAAGGVVTGYGDGSFRPGAPVTRQAAMAVLWRSAERGA